MTGIAFSPLYFFKLINIINSLPWELQCFWASFYPPNGWRCRCRVSALSNYNLKKKDTKPGNSAGLLSQEMRLVSKKSGEYKPVTVYTDPQTGKKIAPDVGWSHNPASGLVEN